MPILPTSKGIGCNRRLGRHENCSPSWPCGPLSQTRHLRGVRQYLIRLIVTIAAGSSLPLVNPRHFQKNFTLELGSLARVSIVPLAKRPTMLKGAYQQRRRRQLASPCSKIADTIEPIWYRSAAAPLIDRIVIGPAYGTTTGGQDSAVAPESKVAEHSTLKSP